jgi:hypothetical protein
MNPSLRRLAQSGGLLAAAFALKYPLIGLPNVEPLTLAFFALGYAHGARWGAFVGIAGEAIFATFNPMGMSIPQVWGAQVIGMGLVGMAGGLSRPFYDPIWSHNFRIGFAAVAGFGVTLVYDILTNLAFAASIGPFWPVMVAAIPFAAIHVVSNALLFALLFPILSRWLIRPIHPVVPSSAP